MLADNTHHLIAAAARRRDTCTANVVAVLTELEIRTSSGRTRIGADQRERHRLPGRGLSHIPLRPSPAFSA